MLSIIISAIFSSSEHARDEGTSNYMAVLLTITMKANVSVVFHLNSVMRVKGGNVAPVAIKHEGKHLNVLTAS